MSDSFQDGQNKWWKPSWHYPLGSQAWQGATFREQQEKKLRDDWAKASAPPPPPPRSSYVPGSGRIYSPPTELSSSPKFSSASGSSSYRQWQLPGIFRYEWWRNDTPLHAVIVAGDWVARSKIFLAIAGTIAAILFLVSAFTNPQFFAKLFDNDKFAPYFWATVVGCISAAAIWLLAKTAYFAGLIFAFALAWGLRICVVTSVLGAIAYGVAVTTHQTDLVFDFLHSAQLLTMSLLHRP